MQQPSDEIKSKLDIVEVIREYINLKAAGVNFRSVCPFHREKTPSFMVSSEKQIWHCFGCGKGGDIFSFIMEIEGITFAEALRLLAKKAGVVLKRSDPRLTSQRNRLLDITDLAVRYYHKVLLDSPRAEPARKYLSDRALTEETTAAWQIGYSFEAWDSLVNFLKSKGYGENEIFLAGLIVKKERQSGFYDRFRGRIMFPISDLNGSVVGFSARVLPGGENRRLAEADEKMGKYINSPQTMIYNKSQILFGLDKARLAIKKEDLAIIVEGQMDAITAHQAGFANVVASSGTSLTAQQVALLKRYTMNLVLAFDMDKAGDLAAERGIAQAMQAELNIKVIEISGGKDPDECIRRNPEEWKNAVSQAKPMMEYFFNKTFSKLNPLKLEQKRQAIKTLLPVIAKLGNKIEQDHWLKQLTQITDVDEKQLREEFFKTEKINPQYAGSIKEASEEKNTNVNDKLTREEILSELLLALILKYPSQLEYIANRLGTDELFDEINQIIYRNLIVYYNRVIETLALPDDFNIQAAASEPSQNQPTIGNRGIAINYHEFKVWLKENEPALINQNDNNQPSKDICLKRLDRLVLLADKEFYDYSSEQAKNETINILKILKKNYLSRRLKQIAKLISQTEKENLPDQQDGKITELKALMEEFTALTEEISEIE
ncbi:MAG: DNA primase [bacterium]